MEMALSVNPFLSFSIHATFKVFTHFKTNQTVHVTWFMWLVDQFPHIHRLTTKDWECGWTHSGTSQAWLNFGYAMLNFHRGLWFSCFKNRSPQYIHLVSNQERKCQENFDTTKKVKSNHLDIRYLKKVGVIQICKMSPDKLWIPEKSFSKSHRVIHDHMIYKLRRTWVKATWRFERHKSYWKKHSIRRTYTVYKEKLC